jgi:hypothetical protein
MDDGAHLISIDPDPAAHTIARQYLGDDPRLDMRTVPAEDWLPGATAGPLT